MALGWVLFIKILLLLLALCPASIHIAGQWWEEGRPGPLPAAPSVVRDQGQQVLLQQGYSEHEAAPQQQPQPLQQHVGCGKGLRRTQQGRELEGKKTVMLPALSGTSQH